MDFPKFYEIDGLLVVVTYEDDDLVGRVVPSGKQYPPLKAQTQGEELRRDEFLTKLKSQFPDSKLTSLF